MLSKKIYVLLMISCVQFSFLKTMFNNSSRLDAFCVERLGVICINGRPVKLVSEYGDTWLPIERKKNLRKKPGYYLSIVIKRLEKQNRYQQLFTLQEQRKKELVQRQNVKTQNLYTKIRNKGL